MNTALRDLASWIRRGDGEALNHPLVEQGPRTLTPYPVSQVAQPR